MLKGFKKIHFIGIGGYGMSALAQVLIEEGYQVSGSDISSSSRIDFLKELGVEIYLSHKAENINSVDLVIYSTAIPGDNPELLAAKQRGISLWHRSELLAELINSRYGIAITGAHGKTTTTSMLSLILEEASADPTCIIGGELPNFGSNARVGDSEYVVAEACESDHSFLRYSPQIAVITNIEADHLEHYNGSFDQLLKSYRQFIENIDDSGKVFIYSECEYHDYLLEGMSKNCKTFGFSQDADFRATDLKLNKGTTEFTIESDLADSFKVELMVPGEHNILNALAAASVALDLKISPTAIKRALQKFTGAKRRFMEIGQLQGATIVDDYAHHPTEIKATLKTAQEQSDNKVIAIFQPHRFTRTQYFMDDFASSFEEADTVILHKVFAAGEDEIPGANSKNLKDKIKENVPGLEVYVTDDMEDIAEIVSNIVDKGDYVITMGAGDIWKVAHWLVDEDYQKQLNSEG
ncbi:UDP-N-acetylmuramate--L-alanine ligase [Natranaerobius thermophilus]|uniref:UDP-N-acetylmuramate--L-alanine ligase n=1 Tax=Natranaerobius thermophilus (strain ATCC BAA-1301 / DSM 18059 / JW/NM-WN-LF) TaxID=457570 RepID=B2A5Q1_NATTJ|nr:UDP-N-acetylmuramate--L-alanine ligase [Natranaerobius thermophilus]ACB83999.1 UDP-N-acetylmuramate--alanine ligase [Natranaerobius thermophilus JW/NM-WN-LF]